MAKNIYGARSNCYWIETTAMEQADPLGPLRGDIKADVAIVGGGYTGLATAYYLAGAFPEKKIVVLEAARIGYGASGRNDGLVLPLVVGAEGIIDDLIGQDRIDAARDVFDKTSAGIGLIHSLVEEHRIDCDWEPTNCLVGALSDSKIQLVEEKHRRYRALGLDSELLDSRQVREHLNISEYKAAVTVPVGAMLNPAKLARGMIPLLQARGVDIYEDSPVAEISSGASVSVSTPKGSVAAQTLVLAPNAYTSRLGFFKRRVIPIHTYNIATEPLSDKQVDALNWRGRRPICDVRNFFDLFRLTTDNRIIHSGGNGFYHFGDGLGEDENHPDYKRLERNLHARIPALEGLRVTHRWCGHVGLTLDMMPTVGVTGAAKNIYYGLGYSGHGVPVAFLAGKLICDLYSGRPIDPACDFFINRRPPGAPPEPLRSVGFALYKRYLRWVDSR